MLVLMHFMHSDVNFQAHRHTAISECIRRHELANTPDFTGLLEPAGWNDSREYTRTLERWQQDGTEYSACGDISAALIQLCSIVTR